MGMGTSFWLRKMRRTEGNGWGGVLTSSWLGRVRRTEGKGWGEVFLFDYEE